LRTQIYHQFIHLLTFTVVFRASRRWAEDCRQDSTNYRHTALKTVRINAILLSQKGSLFLFTLLCKIRLEIARADPNVIAVQALSRVSGIGPVLARKLVFEDKITTIEQLKALGDTLTHHQQVGLKYMEPFEKRIPRDEMDKWNVRTRKYPSPPAQHREVPNFFFR
jgi:hypothetical protein